MIDACLVGVDLLCVVVVVFCVLSYQSSVCVVARRMFNEDPFQKMLQSY